uniref:Uncharacterized protein n=1 Tax=Anguilla anguilla TaxID=7936 RepID=A0A0E9UWD7_ANGAN
MPRRADWSTGRQRLPLHGLEAARVTVVAFLVIRRLPFVLHPPVLEPDFDLPLR